MTGQNVARQHQMVTCRMIVVARKRTSTKVVQRIKQWKLKKEDCCDDLRERLEQVLGDHEELPNDWVTTETVIRETAGAVMVCCSE